VPVTIILKVEQQRGANIVLTRLTLNAAAKDSIPALLIRLWSRSRAVSVCRDHRRATATKCHEDLSYLVDFQCASQMLETRGVDLVEVKIQCCECLNSINGSNTEFLSSDMY
jgi:hypothetical protein